MKTFLNLRSEFDICYAVLVRHIHAPGLTQRQEQDYLLNLASDCVLMAVMRTALGRYLQGSIIAVRGKITAHYLNALSNRIEPSVVAKVNALMLPTNAVTGELQLANGLLRIEVRSPVCPIDWSR